MYDDLTEEEFETVSRLLASLEVSARLLAVTAYARANGIDEATLRKMFDIQLAAVKSAEDSVIQARTLAAADKDARQSMRTAAGLDLKSVPMNDKPKGERK